VFAVTLGNSSDELKEAVFQVSRSRNDSLHSWTRDPSKLAFEEEKRSQTIESTHSVSEIGEEYLARSVFEGFWHCCTTIAFPCWSDWGNAVGCKVP
jgi:hypothetical protein